jgi:molecular chaperone HscC
VKILVFQGENRLVKHNLLLGELIVEGIPKGPPGQEVDIRFTYDLNGVLEVEATIVATQRTISHVITRLTHGLSPQQIAQAVQEMQSLKVVPWEQALYQALIKRGDRLYAELPLQAQQYLGELLHGMEEALELSEKESLERHREALEEFFSEHDPDWRNGMEEDSPR